MKPFIVMEILERARQLEEQGREIIHLEIGEPDFNPPEQVQNSVVQALKNQKTHYTESFGISELREEIFLYYKRFYNVFVEPQTIIVTTGTSAAFILALGSVFNKGDKIVITDPGYPCYKNFIEFLQLEPVIIPVFPENDFSITREDIEKYVEGKNILGAIITSPANPTGSIVSKKIFSLLKQKNSFNNIR